jgi:hypothetical protein
VFGGEMDEDLWHLIDEKMEGSDRCEECKDEASFKRKPATLERKISRC